jgi:hypothetical protein
MEAVSDVQSKPVGLQHADLSIMEQVIIKLVTCKANQWDFNGFSRQQQQFHGLKEHLYQRHVHDPAWHVSVYDSLLHSYYSVSGQMDTVQARRIVDILTLPEDMEYRAEFYAALTQGERCANAYWGVEQSDNSRQTRRCSGHE